MLAIQIAPEFEFQVGLLEDASLLRSLALA